MFCSFEEMIKNRREYPILIGDYDSMMESILDGSYNNEYALLSPSVLQKNIYEIHKFFMSI